ncbi:MAG: GAF domain-containing protein, partial [Deltaproteobacteria bacterium]|nr:GAF domain-containing protein [Deltaproteobacteria bacterium]
MKRRPTMVMDFGVFSYSGWVIPPLVSFITLVALGVVAFWKGRGRKTSLLFGAICFVGGLLSLDKALGSVVTDPAVALRISRMDHAFVVFFVPFYLHFTFSFLEIQKRKWLVWLAYLLSTGLSIASQHQAYLVSARHYYFGYYALGGPLVYVFATASTANTIACMALLCRALAKEKDPERKNKIKYIIVGLGGAALMAHVDFLPVVGLECYPAGNFAFIPLLILGFGVLKHDLLDIGLALRTGLLYSFLTGLVTGSYALLIIAFDYFFKDIGQRWSLLFSAVFFVGIVFVFDPLKRKVQCVIDGLLFQGKYDYQKTLRSLSQTMASMLNLKEIMDKTLDTLTHSMDLSWSCILLLDDGGSSFSVRSRTGGGRRMAPPAIRASSPLILELTQRKREITRHSLTDRVGSGEVSAAARSEFDRLGGSVVIPMIFKTNLNGIIVLGDKRSGDMFTPVDFELLCTLGNQCAVAVENAKAYGVIRTLNANLEARVADRTASLRKALREKEKTQERLIRSESLASVGALVAGVAHELNNPLASVSSLVQSALEALVEADCPAGPGTEVDPETRAEIVDDLRFSLKELNRAAEIV